MSLLIVNYYEQLTMNATAKTVETTVPMDLPSAPIPQDPSLAPANLASLEMESLAQI